MLKELSAEQKILTAAEEVFHSKGYDGARMQEIAEQAGLNKGLLHYYFKTKDKLFEAIFGMALNRMVTKVLAILELELPLEEKIGLIVDEYMGLLLKNPDLPRFVLNELNKDADKFVHKHINGNARTAFDGFVASVQSDINEKKIKKIDPRQLFMSMMSLMIFPFMGRPLLQSVVGVTNDEFKQLMAERRAHIKEFIYNALKA